MDAIANRSHGDAWLLEILALHRVPIHMLAASPKAVSEWLNRGFHGLERSELFDALSEMFNANLVAAYKDGVRELERFSGHDLAVAIEGGLPSVFIGVTECGGHLWETKANADWDRYVEDIGWNGKDVQLSATTQSRLLQVINDSRLCWSVEMQLDPETFRELAPWKPFPWKQLPRAWQVKASYREVVNANEAGSEHMLRWADSVCGL